MKILFLILLFSFSYRFYAQDIELELKKIREIDYVLDSASKNTMLVEKRRNLFQSQQSAPLKVLS